MGNFVYVGKLASSTTEEALGKKFAAKGFQPRSVVILQSSNHDRSRGFGFVEVGSEEEVETAIQTMNGVELDGNKLAVDRVRERASSLRGDGRGFQSYSGLGFRPSSGPRRSGGAKRKSRG